MSQGLSSGRDVLSREGELLGGFGVPLVILDACWKPEVELRVDRGLTHFQLASFGNVLLRDSFREGQGSQLLAWALEGASMG